MTDLRMDTVWITNVEAGAFRGLANLPLLNLTSAQITRLESGTFEGLSNLKTLYLGRNKIRSFEGTVFSDLNKLQTLALNDNRIRSIERGMFRGLNELQSLNLDDNQIVRIEDGAFSGLSNLQTLRVWNNPFLEAGNFSRANFNSLTLLDMAVISDLILDDAELNLYATDQLMFQAWPVNASLVGVRFADQQPGELLANASRLQRLTIDQYLYDSYSDEIDTFASEAGKTLIVIGYGDSNRDGFFDSGDLVQVFEAGEYEDGVVENSYWTTGDWNSDGEFDSSDLVVAFIDGQYEAAALPATVPEPSAIVLLSLGLISLQLTRRHGEAKFSQY